MNGHAALAQSLALALLTNLLVCGAAARERRVLAGHVPAAAQKAAAIGRLPSASALNLAIGLREFDGYYPGDITTYESLAHLPNVPLQVVLLDGFDGVPTPPSAVEMVKSRWISKW
jgi:hypothetical protein